LKTLYARFFILAALPFCPTLFDAQSYLFYPLAFIVLIATPISRLRPFEKNEPRLSKHQLGASLLKFSA
jgi:hypothetical protein